MTIIAIMFLHSVTNSTYFIVENWLVKSSKIEQFWPEVEYQIPKTDESWTFNQLQHFPILNMKYLRLEPL